MIRSKVTWMRLMVIVVESKMVTRARIMRAHLRSTIRQRDASHVQ